jgi:predicted aspartyl protease
VIERLVTVDTGFSDDISLEPSDIIDLGLGDPISRTTYEIADGEISENNVYQNIEVTVRFMNGDVRTVSVTPVAPIAVENYDSSVVLAEQRLLGFGALNKLDLKVDCKRRCLFRKRHRK